MSPLEPPDRAEYTQFCKAVSDAIHDLGWQSLTLRYRIAARAWRVLHPDSRCGERR